MNYLSTTSTYLSFLKARDPSIITANEALVRAKDNLRTNLALDKLQETMETEEENRMQIYLRVKNEDLQNLYKIDKKEIHCYISNDFTTAKSIKDGETVTRKYTFSHIFDPHSTQTDIFNFVVKPKVLKFINGENSTLMTYGASGSGKTFTIVGTVAEPGIIPRTLEYLFRTVYKLPDEPLIKPTQSGEVKQLTQQLQREEKVKLNDLLNIANATIDRQHTNTYRAMQQRLSTEPAGILDDSGDLILAVWVSFAEIYNEYIYDLLTPTQVKGNARPKLQLGAFNENTYIKSLTNISVSSGIEAYQILQYGLHNLNYAATSINSHSSRSHCIFTIKIAQMIKNSNEYCTNYFNFCDLAGSEKLKKTLNVGDRLKESNSINTSLLVLGRCISCILENQKKNTSKLIPFRESKLTRFFQRALTGHETICMVVNMNPCPTMFDESLHVLNFSAIAKDISVKHPPVKLKKKNRFSNYLQQQTGCRSTAYSDIVEETSGTDGSKLQDHIDKLYYDMEQQRRHFIEEEQIMREEVIQEYGKLIDYIEQQHRQHVKSIEARHRKEYQMLQEEYENKNKNVEIINLDSSDDEECVAVIEEDESVKQREQIVKLKAEIIDLKNELSKSTNINLNQEKTLQDATVLYETVHTAYDKQNERIEELLTENLKLTEARNDLSTQVEAYKTMQANMDDNEENEM